MKELYVEGIPDWAFRKACDVVPIKVHHVMNMAEANPTRILIETLARHIAKYEDEPVDPRLLRARELAAQWYDDRPDMGPDNPMARNIRKGLCDGLPLVTVALAALRDGDD